MKPRGVADLLRELRPADAPAADPRAAAEAERLRAVQRASLAAPERVAEYTLDRVTRWFAIVAAPVAVCIATATGVLLARWHGLVVPLTLALPYVSLVLIVCALGLRAHISIVAASLAAMGVLVDFSLYVAYNPDAWPAVAVASLVTLLGVSPLVLSDVPATQAFAIIYAGLVVVGALFAVASVATRRFDAL